ncbi:MAG TPA: RES family NAD+ phosphorylase [Thermoanaerobaculia bacterium]|nr:RES family NAD+ phosphorylase [Thermoanaerobaculia bacterium]
MLTAWRLTEAIYAADAFGGEGAREFGGRWSSPGYWVVHTSEHVSLAILEVLANAFRPKLLPNFVLASCTFDESLVTHVEIEELPLNWRDPRPPVELRDFGDEWIRSERSAVLSVPSVIVDHERNYLLNPAHEDFRRIKLSTPELFRFDPRLVT